MAELSEEDKRQAYEEEKSLVQELFTAVGLGDIERLKTFVLHHLHDDYSQLQHYKDANKRNPLHFAAHAGQAEMCNFLRQHMAPSLLTAADDQGYAPWALAARSGHPTALQALLPDNLSSAINAKHLFDAASSGNVQCFVTLINSLTGPGTGTDAGTGTGAGAEAGAGAGAGVGLNESGKDVCELLALLDEEREIGTVVHGATFSKNIDMLDKVLEAGANVDPADADGVTPLMVACGLGSKEMVERLLAAGASVEKRTKHNSTCFHTAAVVGADDVLQVLLATKPSVLAVKNTQDASSGEDAEASTDGVSASLTLDFSSPEDLSKSVHVGRAETIARLEEDGRKISTTCEGLKSAGNEQFKAREFAKAIKEYTAGIEKGDAFLGVLEQNEALLQGSLDTLQKRVSSEVIAPLYGNRCMALLKSKRLETALKDAETATTLSPKWPKAKYRLGQCHTALKQYAEAAQAYWDGYQLSPKADGAEAMLKLFKASVKLGKQQVQETEKRKHSEAAKPVYDKSLPIEIPVDNSGEMFKTLTLRYNNSENPADIAGRFITENKLDPSLIPRVAHHVHNSMKDEQDR